MSYRSKNNKSLGNEEMQRLQETYKASLPKGHQIAKDQKDKYAAIDELINGFEKLSIAKDAAKAQQKTVEEVNEKKKKKKEVKEDLDAVIERMKGEKSSWAP
ncbi:hypothetical protein PG994_014017 [Apiospora phragmitis]|uniref:Uncharacterized protein n=1 Tax=Apiospora phragmitis TaxID=2905665 RepID=A0ABR1T320_9PEZI